MSTLYKRGKIYYYRNGANLRISLKTHNYQRAKAIKKKLDHQYELEAFGIFFDKSRNVKQLWEEWRDFIITDKSDAWWKDNTLRINTFVSMYKDRPVVSIRPKDINDYISDLKKGRAPNTVLNYMKPIRQMFQYAVSNSYIDKNPIESALLPTPKEKRRFKAIPKNILENIFADETIDVKHRNFWKLCYYTGLDAGDAGMLTEKDIVMADIPYIQLDRDKSDEPTQIPIHRDLNYNIINMMPMKSTRQSSSKKLKRELAKYNIMGSLKNLRASFVSHLHDQGLSTQDIKVAVGHTSSKMTAHYTTAQLESVAFNINRL